MSLPFKPQAKPTDIFCASHLLLRKQKQTTAANYGTLENSIADMPSCLKNQLMLGWVGAGRGVCLPPSARDLLSRSRPLPDLSQHTCTACPTLYCRPLGPMNMDTSNLHFTNKDSPLITQIIKKQNFVCCDLILAPQTNGRLTKKHNYYSTQSQSPVA